MKKGITIFCFLLSFLFIAPSIAQDTKEIKKEIQQKALKEARKEAKTLSKEGFKVSPGQKPMDKQIEDAWMTRYQKGADGYPAYFVADARSTGESHSVAKLQANEVAKINLVGQIGTEVAGLVETNLANSQLSSDDAVSITETVGTFKSIIGSKLGRTLILFEASKSLKDNTEVFITIAYSYEKAIAMSKDVIRQELKEKTKLNAEALDKILDF